MNRRLHLFAHHPRKLRHRIQFLDLIDQVEQNPFLIVSFAKKSPINPLCELSPELQAQSRRRDDQKQKRIAAQDRGQRTIAIDDDRPGQRGQREREDHTEDLLGKQMLHAAPDDDLNIEDSMFEHSVTAGYGDGYGHKFTDHECEVTDTSFSRYRPAASGKDQLESVE